jgi:hypothetical protein
LDATEWGFPELRAEAAGFKYSVKHCALTLLDVFIMISMDTTRFSKQNSKI